MRFVYNNICVKKSVCVCVCVCVSVCVSAFFYFLFFSCCCHEAFLDKCPKCQSLLKCQHAAPHSADAALVVGDVSRRYSRSFAFHDVGSVSSASSISVPVSASAVR
jgi:hypothetical protein